MSAEEIFREMEVIAGATHRECKLSVIQTRTVDNEIKMSWQMQVDFTTVVVDSPYDAPSAMIQKLHEAHCRDLDDLLVRRHNTDNQEIQERAVLSFLELKAEEYQAIMTDGT